MSDEARPAEKALYFVLGAFVGAVAALMLAPRSGEETRRLITERARGGADYLSSRGKEIADKASGFVDRGKEAIQHQRDQLSAALEAGKQAYRDEKDKAKT